MLNCKQMQNKKSIFPEGMTSIEKVAAFLSKAGVFFVATTEDGQPKVRPFSYLNLQDDRLYFASGTFKEIYKQLKASPKVEIFAHIGAYFMRYDGVAVIVEDDESLMQHLRHSAKHMTDLYAQNGWKNFFFYLENGHVEIRESLYPAEKFDV